MRHSKEEFWTIQFTAICFCYIVFILNGIGSTKLVTTGTLCSKTFKGRSFTNESTQWRSSSNTCPRAWRIQCRVSTRGSISPDNPNSSSVHVSYLLLSSSYAVLPICMLQRLICGLRTLKLCKAFTQVLGVHWSPISMCQFVWLWYFGCYRRSRSVHCKPNKCCCRWRLCRHTCKSSKLYFRWSLWLQNLCRESWKYRVWRCVCICNGWCANWFCV